MPTSSLLQMAGLNIVVDCGLGVSQGLIRRGVGLQEVDLIFVTHLHSDHYLELGPLLHTAWTAGLNRKVPVIGPSGLGRYIDGFLASMKDDIDLRIADEGRPDLREMIALRLLEEGHVEFQEGLHVTAMRNDHPPLLETYALRFEGDGCCVVFSGDTATFEPMADFASGADLLVHEAMLMDGVDALCARVGNADDRLRQHLLRAHTPAGEVGRIASRAGVRILALHHLVPSDDPDFTEDHWRAEVGQHFTGDLRIGRDGLVIDL
jgi:ribonuclease BN (tRNA processing enzyme)